MDSHSLGTTLRSSGRSWSRCLMIFSETNLVCHIFPTHAHQQRLPLPAWPTTTNGMMPAWWNFATGFGVGRTYGFPHHSDRCCPIGFRLPLQPLALQSWVDLPKPWSTNRLSMLTLKYLRYSCGFEDFGAPLSGSYWIYWLLSDLNPYFAVTPRNGKNTMLFWELQCFFQELTHNLP